MNRSSATVCLLVAQCILLSGCDKDPARAAFDSAAPDLKTSWSQAVADSSANHYFAANTNFVSLLRRELNPAQMSAVQGALSDLNVRMNEAASKGDADAKQAIAALQALQQQRRVPGGPLH